MLADVTKLEHCAAAVRQTVARWGRLDILVNNVGIGGPPGTAVEVDPLAWDEIRVQTIEHHPPDTTACIFWLKNRQPGKWRDKVDPGQAAARFNFIGMVPSEEEWIKRYGSHPRAADHK